MERFITLIIVVLAIGGGVFVYLTCEYSQENDDASYRNLPSNNTYIEEGTMNDMMGDGTENEEVEKEANIPLDRSFERITKKPFALYVDSDNSPVQPERFRGYHTGVDLEIFDGEEDVPVEVRSICDGTIVMRDHISGYGGVIVQACTIDDGALTIVYGHLDLETVVYGVDAELSRGDVLGVLGAGGSRETDGERKHLHLGIHRGTAIDLRGYVADRGELSGWIDPCTVLMCDSK